MVRPGFYAGQECGALGVGRAIKRGWASQHWANPYWASHQTRLGEPVPRGRWASPYSLGEPVLGEPLNHFHSGQRLRLLGAVPRHIYKCLLGTST